MKKKDYKKLEKALNSIELINTDEADKIVNALKTTFDLDIEFCETCNTWRIESYWHEDCNGDPVCQSCYEIAIDLAYDSMKEYNYQGEDY